MTSSRQPNDPLRPVVLKRPPGYVPAVGEDGSLPAQRPSPLPVRSSRSEPPPGEPIQIPLPVVMSSASQRQEFEQAPEIPSAPDDEPIAVREPGVNERHLGRRPCSYPGVLRVLVPEQSFDPIILAVRIIDVSPGGARVETRQLTREVGDRIAIDPRFIRLDILIPTRDRITVCGKTAWVEHGPEYTQLGVSFNPRREDLAESCLPEWKPDGMTDSKFLQPPILDSFPTQTSRNPVRFTGVAWDAESVLVRVKDKEFRTAVNDDRFTIEVPLEPQAANEIYFVSLVSNLASDPTPAWVVHRPGKADTRRPGAIGGLFDEVEVSPNKRQLKVRFKGDARLFAQVLQRFDEMAPMTETISFTLEATGDAERAASALKHSIRFPWSNRNEDSI